MYLQRFQLQHIFKGGFIKMLSKKVRNVNISSTNTTFSNSTVYFEDFTEGFGNIYKKNVDV